jgi:hypothetical protein
MISFFLAKYQYPNEILHQLFISYVPSSKEFGCHFKYLLHVPAHIHANPEAVLIEVYYPENISNFTPIITMKE